MRKIDEKLKQKALKLYSEGKSCKDVAKVFGVSHASVANWARAAGTIRVPWSMSHKRRKPPEEVQRKRKTYQREYRLKVKYGISIEDYNRLFNSQQGCCAICNKHQLEIGEELCVDHDHITGVVRGLLCKECNLGLGNLKIDSCDTQLLYNAIEYVKGTVLVST